MKNKNRKYRAAILFSILTLLLVAPYEAQSSPQDFHLTPSNLSIGTFFGGVSIRVEALIPNGCQAVIEVNGKDLQEDLMRKGRHWDLWMNTGEIHVNGVPNLYYLMSTDPQLLQFPPQGDQWGYSSLRKDISFTGQLKQTEDAKLFKEFINLKEGQGLYHILPGGLKTTISDPKQHVVQGDIDFSPRTPPGIYTIRIFVLKGRNVIERRKEYVHVKLTGIPALINRLSSQHDYLYGFLAVFIAASFGLLSGFVFKSKGKGGAGH
jgi:hypothetical protein